MKKTLLFSAIAIVVLVLSCAKDHDGRTSVDTAIEDELETLGMSLEDFRLARSLEDIPQSIDNPITQKKIELGRSIFWDPIFHQNTFGDATIMTASCGSCHIKDGHAGVSQGLGEGGISAGVNGEKRIESTDFINNVGIEFVDAQPIRVPTNMHVAYKPNALWDGALGNPNTAKLKNNDRPNQNESISFPDGFPHDLARTFDGFGGAEMQALAGLRVHRYKFNEEIISNAGSRYKELFDEVFVEDSETRIIDRFADSKFIQNNMFLDRGKILLDGGASGVTDDSADDVYVPIQYSRLAAALAVSAYTRSVLANEAPFQDFVFGDPNGMTEQQKRGFLVFLEKKCINCHNGPALTDADFHAMGAKDLLDLDPNLQDRINNPIAGFSNPEDLPLGRYNVSGKEEDRGAFMTQTLYNLQTNIFFHGGENIKLSDAVKYMLDAEMNEGKDFAKDPNWNKQNYTDQELADLVEFIDNGLRDLNFDDKYRPGIELSKVFSCNNTMGTNGENIKICSPSNDNQSNNGEDDGIICCE